MRLICFWCAILAVVKSQAQGDAFYAPQTYRHSIDTLQKGYFTPTRDVTPQGSALESWRPGPAPLLPAPVKERWGGLGPISPPAHIIPKVEPWRSPYPPSKEQKASILHHKQALTSEGAFRFEYASDNGLAAGEQIEPDGSRVGAYQYKDPNGQLISLKYRAGKDGFQILEGSHLPKSPEPVAPPMQDNHYQQAYEQQQRAYQLQQQHNQQPLPQTQPQAQWRDEQGEGQKTAGGQYFVQNWRPQDGQEDDGQYRENGVEEKGPHSFGEGYAFSFKGQ